MNKTSVIALSGDLLGAAASAALLTRLFRVCDDDLRRLRERIHKSPRTAPDLLDWLDHACGWEQDRRAGYAYPLRNPSEAIHGRELSNSIAALELLAATFSGAAQVTTLLNLVRMIVSLNRPSAPPEARPVYEGMPQPVIERSWPWMRARTQPNNDVLRSTTVTWMARLPKDMRPMALAGRYPRIANNIANFWRRVARCEEYLDSLVVDRRGGRTGFPPDVAQELSNLRRFYAALYPKNGSGWKQSGART